MTHDSPSIGEVLAAKLDPVHKVLTEVVTVLGLILEELKKDKKK